MLNFKDCIFIIKFGEHTFPFIKISIEFNSFNPRLRVVALAYSVDNIGDNIYSKTIIGLETSSLSSLLMP